MAISMQFIKNVVEVQVVNRTTVSMTGVVLQQVRELMTASVRQQVKGAQLTAEITPPVDLPAGKPATGRVRLVFSLNHAKAVGDLVLFALGIEAVIGGMTRTYPAHQSAVGSPLLNPGCRRLPEHLLRNSTHQLAELAGLRFGISHGR